MTKRTSICSPLALIVSLTVSNSLWADDALNDSLQTHGFLTQSLIVTDHNNFFGKTSDNDHLGFTEAGVNVSYRPRNDLQLSGQLLSRRAGDTDGGKIRIDYALIDKTFAERPDRRIGARIGRMLNPLGLYNETRDVAFARPSIFLPQSIYFDRNRDLAISSDGVYFYGENRRRRTELLWQVGAGYPRVGNEEIERSFFLTLQPGYLESSSTPSYLGRVLLEIDGGRYVFGMSGAHVRINYRPGGGDVLNEGLISFAPMFLSAQYNGEFFELTSEYAQREFTFQGFGPFRPDQSFTSESAYLQGVYRFNKSYDLLARYDVLYVDQSDRHGKAYSALTGLPAFTRFSRDATLGVGWHVNHSLLLRLEYHSIIGTAWLDASDNLVPSNLTRSWNMYAALASFRF
ncbi:MAG: hypothetical protein GC138_07640 [Gammaproteobacteria bacterium]|nr:hypothetical protein [Gammaproteobacteria bacterium]